MINVRDTPGLDPRTTSTFYCRKCETDFGVPVEFNLDLCPLSIRERNQRVVLLKKFEILHRDCGEQEIYLRIEKVLPDTKFHFAASFARECYAEDPKMPFTEIQKRYQQRKADLAEIQTPETDL